MHSGKDSHLIKLLKYFNYDFLDLFFVEITEF